MKYEIKMTEDGKMELGLFYTKKDGERKVKLMTRKLFSKHIKKVLNKRYMCEELFPGRIKNGTMAIENSAGMILDVVDIKEVEKMINKIRKNNIFNVEKWILDLFNKEIHKDNRKLKLDLD